MTSLATSLRALSKRQAGGANGAVTFHAAILRLEFVERPLAETVLAAHIRCRHPCFLLFDHPNNLGFAKSALSHLFAPSKG